MRPDYPAKERRQGGTFRRGQEVGRCRKEQPYGNFHQRVFFDHPEYIIHTDAKRDTDPYGKPAMVYTHSGGVEGIATDLYRILSADLSARLDLERYNGVKGERQEPRQVIVVQPAQAEAKKEMTSGRLPGKKRR